MTVGELIETLQLCDKDKMVVVSGYEGGENEVDSISEVDLLLNQNTEWYYGKHEVAFKKSPDTVTAIKLA